MKLQLLGKYLDIREDEKITYVIQVQDLADVSTVNSSVTTSFKLPKTSNNYEALKYLSLNSDTSRVPYTRNACKLYDNGTILVNNGWLKINSTDENNFNVNIENGIIDFFKAIENKTIGGDLDLSETKHNKDLVSVIDSFERNDYCYIVADYNGLNTFFKNQTEFINTDYLIPSLNNKYLWDKVFNTFGYTYEGSVFDTEDFTNLWITYPKAPPIINGDEEEVETNEPLIRLSAEKENNISYTGDFDLGIINFRLDNAVLNGVELINNEIIISEDGTYQLDGYIRGVASYETENNYGDRSFLDKSVDLYMYRNGVLVSNTENVPLRAGDKLRFVGVAEYPLPNEALQVNGLMYLSMDYYKIILSQKSQTIIDFGNEFLNTTITEFVKENLIRFSLTPIIDVENRHIKFLTLNERLNSSKVVDWSEKYVARVNETYTYKDYAIDNYFKHKYNDQDADYNNGTIFVNNSNLEDDKDLYQSKFYSYNKEVTKFYSNSLVNNSFPLWDREIKETVDNDTNVKTYEVNYKGLENRFYFIRRTLIDESFNFGSQLLNVTDSTDRVAIVNTRNLAYNEIIASRYSNFSKVLNDTRIHEISLILDINDLLKLDLEALYYFNQENQYYLLNKLDVDFSTRVCKGEFVRVNYR